MKKAKPRTLHDFVAELGDQNQSVAVWARSHGFTKLSVYEVLRGRAKGRRGKARDILRAMGVTPPPLFNLPAVNGPADR